MAVKVPETLPFSATFPIEIWLFVSATRRVEDACGTSGFKHCAAPRANQSRGEALRPGEGRHRPSSNEDDDD